MNGNYDRMKHRVVIDQLVVSHWMGKKLDPNKYDETYAGADDRRRFLAHRFDITDAVLVAFISDLNSQDEAIRKLMYRGHYLVTLAYAAERLPLLQLDEKGIYRRLRWLRMMGILSVVHRTTTGNKVLAYYKASDIYWRVEKARHEAAARAAQKAVGPRADETEKAMTPGGHGEEAQAIKAMTPRGLGHDPQGSLSLSKEGNTNTVPPSSASVGPLEGPPPHLPGGGNGSGIDNSEGDKPEPAYEGTADLPPAALAPPAVPSLGPQWTEEAHSTALAKMLSEAKRLPPQKQCRASG